VAKHAVLRRGRGVVACGDDQFAAAQVCEGGLDSAFGKAGRVGKRSYARGDRFPFFPHGLAIKTQINQISSWLLIVPDEIAHQDVEDVVVDGNAFAKSRHTALHRQAATLSAIPINGQHFLKLQAARTWTQTCRSH
jgi:hypothetical protein